MHRCHIDFIFAEVFKHLASVLKEREKRGENKNIRQKRKRRKEEVEPSRKRKRKAKQIKCKQRVTSTLSPWIGYG